MLLSELAIIYLATAAPFGVARFLKQNAQGGRCLRAFSLAAGAALAWPLTTLLLLLGGAASRIDEALAGDESLAPDAQRVEQVKRATTNALRAVEDLLVEACGLKDEAARHALFAARESVERYAGLALACASAREEGPSPRELELCRLAGRAGDDLLVAGRCVHRRNVTRLVAHRERARSELVHALAAVREVAHAARPAASSFHSTEQEGVEVVRQISGALLCSLARAVELLSLFDDRATLVSVARLLDAECARLSRLEASPTAARTTVRATEGEESCTTQAVPTAFATPRLRTTTTSPGG